MKIKDLLLGIIFSTVGIAIISMGLFFRSLTNEFEENSEATTATIIRIDEDYRNGKEDYEVYVEFEVDGIRYSGKLDLYHSGMSVGEEVTVYYNKSDPNDFRSNFSTNLITIGLIAFGGVFAIIGITSIVIEIKKNKEANSIKNNGLLINAEVIGVSKNRRIKVNNKHPYIIKCRCEINGELYLFDSNNVWYDAPTIFENLQIKEIPVYISRENSKKYYVDIEAYEKYLPK